MTNFDSDTDSYEDAVNKSIAFSRQGVGYFARRKAAHLLDICHRHLGNPDAVSVVDVGCGVGITDEYLVPHVSALHGVDVSVKALELASARNPAAKYQPCSTDALPFETASLLLLVAIIGSVMLARTLKQEAAVDDVDPDQLQTASSIESLEAEAGECMSAHRARVAIPPRVWPLPPRNQEPS